MLNDTRVTWRKSRPCPGLLFLQVCLRLLYCSGERIIHRLFHHTKKNGMIYERINIEVGGN